MRYTTKCCAHQDLCILQVCAPMIGPMAAGEQLHMAVQVANKLGVDPQQKTEPPERSNAQPIPPAVSFMDVVHEAPRLMELLTPASFKASTATCTQLRRNFRHRVTTITTNEQDQAMLFANKWPRLVIVVISTRLSYEEEMSSLDHFTPYLSKREWATMMRIKVEEGGRRKWHSRFKHSVASQAAIRALRTWTQGPMTLR